MAQQKSNTPVTGEVVRNEDIPAAQVQPSRDRSKAELKADLVNKDDEKLGVLKEPDHLQDQTSVPTEYAPAERPPWATQRFDVPIVTSAVTGAGAHMPPDPEKFDADGRPRDLD